MKNFKYFIGIGLILLPAVSLAVWSAPTAAPTAGNTEPPINVSNATQVKGGQIGATQFCLYSPADRNTPISCLGNPSSPVAFPWITNGNNLENTNTSAGNVYIKNNNVNHDWIFTQPERLTVEGKVKALGLCLGNSCVNVTGNTTNAVTNYNATSWGDLITQLGGGGVKKIIAGNGIAVSPTTGVGDVTVSISNKPDGSTACTDGQVLKWVGTATTGKWTCGSTGAGNVIVNNTSNTTNPLSGTVNRLTKFTGADKIGDSKLFESADGKYIKNDVPIDTTGVNSTSGGFIIEKRTSDPANAEIGRMWFRTDL